MMSYWNQNWLCGPGSGFHGIWGMIIPLAFWLLIIFLAIWFFQLFFRKKNRQPIASVQELLKHRYAAGEIDREEFERLKRELRE